MSCRSIICPRPGSLVHAMSCCRPAGRPISCPPKFWPASRRRPLRRTEGSSMRADYDDAAALLDGLDLDTLLKALVRSRGYEAALRDPPGRRSWSDEQPRSLSFVDLDDRVSRLAGLLSTNHAQPGASVAILAPLGPEALVSILAALRSGLSPLMLPLHANELDLL